MMRAAEIHSLVDWPSILVKLGIPENVLRNKHGPCPLCGGKDKFRFDHAQRGKGSFWCNSVKSGDGFALLHHVFGWDFHEARNRVIEAAGLASRSAASAQVSTAIPTSGAQPAVVANPTVRVFALRRERCEVANCDDVVSYLEGRGLWPLPAGCSLKAHVTVPYWDGGRQIGRYPAIVADVVDLAGDLVTCHVTYLHAGRKLAGYEPRKLLSGMTGREGCAVRLMPGAEVLGVAEGVETALSAAILHGIPVWAALNTALLSRFEPPPSVHTLRVYADRDEPGLTASIRLKEKLEGRMQVNICIPPPPSKDWNDVLMLRN
jgi:putative DNA primase/helicase